MLWKIIFIIISQQILSGKLLLAVIGEQENNFSCGFRLKAYNNSPPRIRCENVIDVTFFNKNKVKFNYYVIRTFCIF